MPTILLGMSKLEPDPIAHRYYEQCIINITSNTRYRFTTRLLRLKQNSLKASPISRLPDLTWLRLHQKLQPILNRNPPLPLRDNSMLDGIPPVCKPHFLLLDSTSPPGASILTSRNVGIWPYALYDFVLLRAREELGDIGEEAVDLIG